MEVEKRKTRKDLQDEPGYVRKEEDRFVSFFAEPQSDGSQGDSITDTVEKRKNGPNRWQRIGTEIRAYFVGEVRRILNENFGAEVVEKAKVGENPNPEPQRFMSLAETRAARNRDRGRLFDPNKWENSLQASLNERKKQG